MNLLSLLIVFVFLVVVISWVANLVELMNAAQASGRSQLLAVIFGLAIGPLAWLWLIARGPTAVAVIRHENEVRELRDAWLSSRD